MSSVQLKITRSVKKQENITNGKEKKQSRSPTQDDPDLELSEDYQIAILNMFKDLKENIIII